MGQRNTPGSKVAGAVSMDKIKSSKTMEKMREMPSPKKAFKGTAKNALKTPGLRKILYGLTFARLMKVLRMIVTRIGARALPVVALIFGGWMFRHMRRRK
jgi:hypothetical protein